MVFREERAGPIMRVMYSMCSFQSMVSDASSWLKSAVARSWVE